MSTTTIVNPANVKRSDCTIEQIPSKPCEHAKSYSTPLCQSKVSAGFPSPAENYTEKSLDLNEFLISHRAATFIFTVTGDSMQGAGILDGDKLVVDRSVNPLHTHIIVAAINGDFTVKRLFKRKGIVELHAENPAYPTIALKESDELIVWGVVIGIVRKLKL